MMVWRQMNRALLLAGPALLMSAAPTAAQSKLPDLPRLISARAVTSMPAPAPTEVIRYGDGPSQQVELFMPASAGTDARLPVVVMVHGGCWRRDLAGPELMRPAAGALVEKGYAVWSISYRRIDEEGGGYPGTYADVARAIDMVREQADARNLDLSRVVLLGHSAGGMLALWAAGRARIPAESPLKSEDPLKPRGVVSAGGFGSLGSWQAQINSLCGDDTLALLAPRVAAPTAAEPAPEPDTDAAGSPADPRFADTSPDRLLPTGVPSVLLHGVYDPAAFPAVALEYGLAARKAGDKADVQIAPVAGHYEVIAPGTAAFAQLLAAIERLSK